MSARSDRLTDWAAEPGLAAWTGRVRGHSADWRARIAAALDGVRETTATPGGLAPGRARPRR